MSKLLDSVRLSTQIEDNVYWLETGKLAKQAHGSVCVQCGDTIVLVTAVTQPLERDIDFMPLMVEYQEMSYAAGRIPGSYFRREIGRPSERETLTSRLIDRPIRPLFPDGFRQEVQVIATVLSSDPEYDPDILSITGASAALHISQIPFQGPIAGARIAYLDGKFRLNPTRTELEMSTINLIMAASRQAVVMVEGQSQSVSEELLIDAISWGHEQLQPFIDLQEELRQKTGKEKMEVTPSRPDEKLQESVRQKAHQSLAQALLVPEKTARQKAKGEVLEQIEQDPELIDNFGQEEMQHVPQILKDLESEIVRGRIKNENLRIDGRDLTTVRELAIETGVLPRVHGSALFARGETKCLGTATLGSTQDEQHVETLSGEENKRFMLHYNFPPYCVGEVKMLRGPSRREIGHGALAEKALYPVLPDPEDFPFTIRLVSEIMESNGSSSMATVCACSLALMDAGIPVSAQVAGIAMGLIQEDDDYYILTDIMGDEDHLGDMDFKVAGTSEGITAIQMDIKISGIPAAALSKALYQSREARLHILEEMNRVLELPRSELSEHAPQFKVVEVAPERIKDVIGPGGKNVKAITKTTGASVDIEDSGQISIFAPNEKALQEAIDMVLFYDQKPEIDKNYTGKVKGVKDFGAFVEILPGVEGMVHISQLDTQRVENINDFINIGDEIKVKVVEIDSVTGKIRLSRKAVLLEEQGKPYYPQSSSKPKEKNRNYSGRDGAGRKGQTNKKFNKE